VGCGVPRATFLGFVRNRKPTSPAGMRGDGLPHPSALRLPQAIVARHSGIPASPQNGLLA
jgi:hypothetical protein